MDTSGHTGWSEEYTEITEGIFRIKVLRGSAKGAEQSTFIWGDVCAGRHVRLEEKNLIKNV